MKKNAGGGSATSSPLLDSLMGYLTNEQVISPLIKKVVWALMPYGVAFIVLNFFTTLLAVGMVIYVRSFYIPLK